VNEEQRQFLRQWHAEWQEYKGRVAALEKGLERLEQRVRDLEQLAMGAADDANQLWAAYGRGRWALENEEDEDE
jgi:hypothetical protein